MDQIITNNTDNITISKMELTEMCFDYFMEGMEASDRDVIILAKEISDFVVNMADAIRRNQTKRRNDKNMLFTKFAESFDTRSKEVLENASKKIIVAR